MGKLSILGAQRVKALTEILDEKEKQTIRGLDTPTRSEIERMVDIEFSINNVQAELNATVEKAKQLAKEINSVTGKNNEIEIRNWGRNNLTDYSSRVDELTSELKDSKVAEVRQFFNSKRQSLWLCETLEEAKAIVGIE
jgi:hypothetical protein